MPEADPIHGETPHDILGVPEGASESEIDATVKELQAKWHPDTATSDDERRRNNEALMRIHEAARDLKDGSDDRTPTQVQLTLKAAETSVSLGETVEFVVTDDAGDPVRRATVSSGDDDDRTGANGRASLSFDAGGTHTVTASKNDTSSEEFVDDTVEVDVALVTERLSVTVADASPTVGETTTATVVDESGAPVSGATVEADVGTCGRTDMYGKASVRVDAAGSCTITAEKESTSDTEFVADSTTVSVGPASRNLQFNQCPQRTTVGSALSVRIVDDTGAPVEGARVRINGETASTDSDGRASLTPAATGRLSIEASKADERDVTYGVTSETVRVEREEVALQLTCESDDVVAGRDATFRVTDDRGRELEDATVSVMDGPSAETAIDGHASLTVPYGGEVTVRAEHDDTDVMTFVEDTLQLDPEQSKRSVALDLPDRIEANRLTTVRVTDQSGTPVSGADVRTGWGASAMTDANGEATIEFTGSGWVTVVAEKDSEDFQGHDEQNVRVE